MRYISTRGTAPELSFADVVLAGLASDGGLYVPSDVPVISPQQWTAWQSLSYEALALEIMTPFVGDSISRDTLTTLIEESYKHFRHTAIAPLKQLSSNEWLLELFHGPTLAFKDFALQFLGRLMDHFLALRGESAMVLGATSGDTGSAALEGCRASARMQSFILFPHERVSDVQRRQMTTIADANVHNIAIKGTFDDCQNMVKQLFADAAFRTQHRLVAVNSINWARILAQIVYYAYAALRLGAPARSVRFCVPTGNFGDIFAGYMAARMGLPIEQLIIATNRNNILARCLHSGSYAATQVEPSLSPSMDIQISSNFERLLFDLYDRDPKAICTLMTQFAHSKCFTLSAAAHTQLKQRFDSHHASDEDTLRTIRTIYDTTGEVLDPHTAVGVFAARASAQSTVPCVTLATAHPAKFPDAVMHGCGVHPALPAHLSDLFERPEKYDVLPHDLTQLKIYLEQHRI